MPYIFITVSGGIIDQVSFHDDGLTAIQALSEFTKTMNPERDDAGIYGPNGMIANAKDFLDYEDRYIDNTDAIAEMIEGDDKPLYIIGSPNHHLKFMINSHHQPVVYDNPSMALSDLGQMRKDLGGQLLLYRLEPVFYPLINREALERYNEESSVEDFQYFLVQEYLK
jgi:hypothetical protein